MTRGLRLPVVLAAALLLAPPAPGAEATFVPPGAPPVTVRAMDADGRTYFAVNDVVGALGGTLAYDASTRSYEAKLRQHTIVFGTEAPLVVVDTRLVNLAVPVRGDGATAYADSDFFQKVVAPLVPATIAWDRATRQLVATRTETPDITVEASVGDFEGTSKVVLKFSQPPVYRVEKSDEQVVLRFPGVRLVSPVPEKVVDDPRVARIVLHPTEIGIVMREKGFTSNVYALGAPPRLVVDVTRAAPAPAATPAAGATPRPAPEAKTVVLDAGHGGTENGAVGPGGLLEKEATLALVKTIREVLTRKGYKVVTTRETDASVALDDRAAAANAAHADVFLSIHCNASRSPGAHGTEVYYLSLDASDRTAAALAESENRTADVPKTAESNAAVRELDLILWDLAQNQHLAASERLSEIVQGDLNRLLGITTRGVKQAPFKVLIGVNAPAVLVEVAFITNPEEEKRLASEEFRRQVAETLGGSLDLFFRKADGIAPGPAAR